MKKLVPLYTRSPITIKTLDISKNACATFESGLKVYDKQVMKYALSHMRFIDTFSPLKMIQAALASFAILSSDGAKTLRGAKFKYRFK